MRYCDTNIPAMDKKCCLVKRVDYAFLTSPSILNDKGLFEPMYGALCDGVNDKLGTVFGEFSDNEFPSNNESK